MGPTLRARLMALVLAVLAPALLVLALGIHQAWRGGTEATDAALQSRAEALAAAVGRELDTTRATLQALASSPHLAAGDLEGFRRQLDLVPQPEGARIVLTDTTGRMRVNSLFPYGTDLPRRGDLGVVERVVATGAPQVSDLYTGPMTGEPLVAVDVPVWLGGEVAYDLNMGFRAEALLHVLAEQRLPEAWIASVLDRRGTLVARSQGQARFVGRPAAPASLAAIAAGASPFSTISQEGWPVRAAHAPVPGTGGWTAVVLVPQDLLRAPLRRSLALFGLGGGGLLLLGLLAAAWQAGAIARPVAALEAGAAALARGGDPPPVPAGVREATRVRAALGEAAVALRAREAERDVAEAALRRLNAELEARVTQRTAALAAGEATARRLYDSSPVPQHSLDEQGRLTAVSDGSLRLTGHAREEVLGRHFLDFVPPAWHERLGRAFAALTEGDELRDLECEVLARDGTALPVLVSARLERDTAGAWVRTYGALVDLRPRRAAEAALAGAQAEREAAQARLAQARKLQALGELAGGVAHDFSNAAAAVLAGVALLEKRHGAALAAAGPGATRLLAGLRDGAERGAAVSRRLLGFARGEALRAVDLDAAELLEGLRAVLANALGPGVRVRVEAPVAGLPPLRADRRQLETVLINLALNARDAMPPGHGGEVVFGAGAEVVSTGGAAHPAGLAPGRYLRLSVADTGRGMDAATLARATEPFFTTKPRDRGTGLGLSMAAGFAAQSGGALGLESEPGRGTVATLWLPQAASADAPAPTAGPRRALVAGGLPEARRLLCHHLRHAGWEAVEVAGTAEALARLDQPGEASFGLMFADLPAPARDGPGFLREVRSRQAGPGLVLLGDPEALPGLAEVAAREGCMVLRKPVAPSELAVVLARHTTGRWDPS